MLEEGADVFYVGKTPLPKWTFFKALKAKVYKHDSCPKQTQTDTDTMRENLKVQKTEGQVLLDKLWSWLCWGSEIVTSDPIIGGMFSQLSPEGKTVGRSFIMLSQTRLYILNDPEIDKKLPLIKNWKSQVSLPNVLIRLEIIPKKTRTIKFMFLNGSVHYFKMKKTKNTSVMWRCWQESLRQCCGLKRASKLTKALSLPSVEESPEEEEEVAQDDDVRSCLSSDEDSYYHTITASILSDSIVPVIGSLTVDTSNINSNLRRSKSLNFREKVKKWYFLRSHLKQSLRGKKVIDGKDPYSSFENSKSAGDVADFKTDSSTGLQRYCGVFNLDAI